MNPAPLWPVPAHLSVDGWCQCSIETYLPDNGRCFRCDKPCYWLVEHLKTNKIDGIVYPALIALRERNNGVIPLSERKECRFLMTVGVEGELHTICTTAVSTSDQELIDLMLERAFKRIPEEMWFERSYEGMMTAKRECNKLQSRVVYK